MVIHPIMESEHHAYLTMEIDWLQSPKGSEARVLTVVPSRTPFVDDVPRERGKTCVFHSVYPRLDHFPRVSHGSPMFLRLLDFLLGFHQRHFQPFHLFEGWPLPWQETPNTVGGRKSMYQIHPDTRNSSGTVTVTNQVRESYQPTENHEMSEYFQWRSWEKWWKLDTAQNGKFIIKLMINQWMSMQGICHLNFQRSQYKGDMLPAMWLIIGRSLIITW